MTKQDTWSWMNFKKTGWINALEQKLYRGKIHKQLDNLSWVILWIYFFATKPTAAMREIVEKYNNGDSVEDYSVIN